MVDGPRRQWIGGLHTAEPHEWNPDLVAPRGPWVRLPTFEVFVASNPRMLAVNGRPLTRRETKTARAIFGNAIDYSVVRIGVAVGLANSPSCFGNFIRLSSRDNAKVDGIDERVFVHEMAHVWQFQTRGWGYLSNSLLHQTGAFACSLVRGRFAKMTEPAYEIDGIGLQKAGSIYKLTAERQARFTEWWFLNKQVEADIWHPHPFRKDTMEFGMHAIHLQSLEVAQHMIAQVRASRPMPQSHWLEEAAWGSSMQQQRIAPRSGEADLIPLIRFPF